MANPFTWHEVNKNMEIMTCVAFKADKKFLADINLLVLVFKLAGYESFWFSCPDFRAPLERNHHPAWLLYTTAPTDYVLACTTILSNFLVG